MNPGSSELFGTEQPSQQLVLSRKLQLLLDASIVRKGSLVTFNEIAAACTARGVHLSRARWFYMKDATGRVVTNPRLLTALSEHFAVSPDYLLGIAGAQTPPLITGNMDFIRALRASRVQRYAARALGGLLPGTLQQISQVLARDMARSPQGAAAGRLGPKQHLPTPFLGDS
ncbi:hypothetical protein [Arthrobacter sp. lap29]|uniref:hypothetical protein n=1 Tax=Arthrobacter sp. lap29 TaxID=3056122 RepID=UPI0028F6E29F|nr:hypothetical protein [Arthrobacter sp. lap29]